MHKFTVISMRDPNGSFYALCEDGVAFDDARSPIGLQKRADRLNSQRR